MKAGKTYFFKNRVYGNGSGFRYRVTLTKPVTATVMLNLNRSDDKAVFNKNNRKEIQVTATVGGTLSVPEISFRDSSLSLCFLGWSTDPGATTGAESIRVTGNETYYAVWTTTVEVTEPNGTEGCMVYQNVGCGSAHLCFDTDNKRGLPERNESSCPRQSAVYGQSGFVFPGLVRETECDRAG